MRADKDGHDAEFHGFMVGRWPSLVRFAYGLTGDHGHAEDLAQAALAKALVAWPRVRRADDPDAYVRRILINLNRRRFRRRRVEEHLGGEAPETPAGDSPDTDRLEERMTLIPALMDLPPGQRAVVILRYWDGLTETQAAAILGCSVGNVRSQASRALARLRTDPRLHDWSAS
ncbi:RNA polymerase sigma-70 factor (sigma-E family) [Catenulispora sp. MAP12-49]|uniref:SigE family RNA polymerase sigma factor n=1 Tax=Catenulispora sp. MAP12-49 TaxID=3156302 RepID=UPI003515CBD4